MCSPKWLMLAALTTLDYTWDEYAPAFGSPEASISLLCRVFITPLPSSNPSPPHFLRTQVHASQGSLLREIYIHGMNEVSSLLIN